MLNCLVAGLYMASYMLMIPTAAEVLPASFGAFTLLKKDVPPLLQKMHVLSCSRDICSMSIHML